MKKIRFLNFIKFISFSIIAVILISCTCSILERKSYYSPWNYMGKLNEFYSLPKESLEYICVGASHAYCTVNPLEIWNETGIKGFVLATQQQPLKASYYYIKEAFKTQKPKVVILEGIGAAITEYDEGALYDCIDPLKPSFNKLSMINSLVKGSGSEAYYFNFIKYHSRWKELDKDDIKGFLKPEYDTYKGFVPLNSDFKSANQIPDYSSITPKAIPEENLETLNDIYQLVKDNDAELVLMIAPYDVEKYGGIFKSEKLWASENNVKVVDFTIMLEQLNIDPDKDYVDSAHLDISGAAKTSKYLSVFLKSFNLTTDTNDAEWFSDYKKYLETAEF